MREAIGGVMSLQIIVVVLLVMNCYLAFSVNYTKAFRVKNEIRSIIEKNEGYTCSADQQIKEFLNKVNYKISESYAGCPVDYTPAYDGGKLMFCYKKNLVDINGISDSDSTYKGAYYTVATFVNLDVPLIQKLLPFAKNIFIVKGETALIYSSGNNSEVSDGCSISETGTST